MFSFFKKKQPFNIRVKEHETSIFITGMEVTTTVSSMKKDGLALQKSFQPLREEINAVSDPRGTVAISKKPDTKGHFVYYIGDFTDTPQQADCFTVMELAPGKYAYVTVPFKHPEDLALAVAKAKRYFFKQWLPNSGYQVKGDIDTIELYDRRSNIALASMDLVFPLEEK